MAKQLFISKSFHQKTLDLIDESNAIIDEYRLAGFDLTLRQLYYQLVTKNIIRNNEKQYNRLGGIINDARLAGLIDWDAIVDRTRNLQGNSHWGSPASILRSAAYGFKLDKWDSQPNRVEVWIEKDALVGVISGICQSLDIDYFSCRGYTSQSEMYVAAQRHINYEERGQSVYILHLGDHDPSGIDMSRDIEDRLFTFGAGTIIKRIALNMPQVRRFSLPPNPGKSTDSRFESYVEEFGSSSWELDALDPRFISDLIEEEVTNLRDDDRWEERLEEEQSGKDKLIFISQNWEDFTKDI